MDIVIPGAAKLWLFFTSALVLLIVPGPAVLFIVTRSAELGRRAGLISGLGIHAATLAHVLAAALGLSALLASSPFFFGVVKYAGAAYLVWLGLKKLFGRDAAPAAGADAPRRSRTRLFRDGFVVNLLNPKTAIFFLAFLPQFVDAGRGHVTTQVIILGLLFALMGFVSDGCYALMAGTVSRWLKGSHNTRIFDRYATGLLFIALGAMAAFAGSQGT